MSASVLRALGYFFGTVGGVSLVLGVVTRLAGGPHGAIMFNIVPVSYVHFAEVCFLFAIALGVGAILEGRTKEKK